MKSDLLGRLEVDVTHRLDIGIKEATEEDQLAGAPLRQRVGVDLLDACQEPVQCPLCCISRDRLSSGGSGEGMAVDRQLVPLIPVDVGGKHHLASAISTLYSVLGLELSR